MRIFCGLICRSTVSPASSSRRRASPMVLRAVDHDGVEVEAVQVVPGFLRRDGEAGLVDQPDQVVDVHRHRAGEALGRHHREVAGRQHRQVEARAAGGHGQTGVLAREAQRDVSAFRQLADDLVEGVRRRRDLARLVDLGHGLVDDLHVQVSGGEGQAVAVGRQEHVRQDGNGVAALDGALHMSKRAEQSGAFNRQLHIGPGSPIARRRRITRAGARPEGRGLATLANS